MNTNLVGNHFKKEVLKMVKIYFDHLEKLSIIILTAAKELISGCWIAMKSTEHLWQFNIFNKARR